VVVGPSHRRSEQRLFPAISILWFDDVLRFLARHCAP
jgi:hypothetical protein